MAEALQIARPFLEKTILALKHADYVESKMGKRGRFRLARPPSEIRLADVVRLFGRPIAPTRCVSKFFFQLTPFARDIGLTQFFKSIRDYSAMRMETITVAEVISSDGHIGAQLPTRETARNAAELLDAAVLRHGD